MKRINWKAVGKGLLLGLKVAGNLVTLGVLHGKSEKIVETAQKIEQAIEEARTTP